jgi:DNA-binding NarL/FixJ family response regulator
VARPQISLLVADSNQTQSQVLASALRRLPGLRVFSCPAELTECLQMLAYEPADVVLLICDGMADSAARLEILSRLHTSYPQMGLVLVVDRYDREIVVNAMRSGARGIFCRATEPFKSLARCISTVHQGQVWANTEQIRYLLDALMLTPQLHIVNLKGDGLLTQREEEVVGLVADGATNREIAESLSIAENTVKKTLFRIYDKLGVSRRVELVLYALAHRDTYHSPSAISGLHPAPDNVVTMELEEEPAEPA